MAFLTNLAKSLVKKTLPDVARNLSPSLASITDDFRHNSSESKDLLLNLKSEIKNTVRSFDGVNPVMKQFTKQLRSGKFGMTSDEAIELSMGSFDGMDDFNSDDSGESISSGDSVTGVNNIKTDGFASSLTAGDGLIADKLDYQTTVNARASRASINILADVSKNIALIAAFHYQQTSEFYSSSLDYYKVSTSFQEEASKRLALIGDHYEHMAETRIKQSQMSNAKGFNIQDIFNPTRLLQKGLDQSGIEMAFGEDGLVGGKLKQFSKDPLGVITAFTFSQLIQSRFKTQINKFNDFMDVLPFKLQKMFGEWSKNEDSGLMGGMKKWIGNFFKLDLGGSKKFSSGKFVDGPVDFDGKTRHAIINVIPLYLSKILSAISGGPQEFYSYESGTFKTGALIKKEFNEKRSTTLKDTYNTGFEALDFDNLSQQQRQQMLKALRKRSMKDENFSRDDMRSMSFGDDKLNDAVRKSFESNAEAFEKLYIAAQKTQFEIHNGLQELNEKNQGTEYDTLQMNATNKINSGKSIFTPLPDDWHKWNKAKQDKYKRENPDAKHNYPKKSAHRAQGGPIIGPGGPTDDAVTLHASHGEFVISAAAAKHYGLKFLNAVNTRALNIKDSLSDRIARNGVKGAAKGIADDVSNKVKNTAKKIKNDAKAYGDSIHDKATEGGKIPLSWANLQPIIINEMREKADKYLIAPMKKGFEKANKLFQQSVVNPLKSKLTSKLLSGTSKSGAKDVGLWGAFTLSFSENVMAPFKKMLIGDERSEKDANKLTFKKTLSIAFNKHILFPLKTAMLGGDKKEARKTTFKETLLMSYETKIMNPLKDWMFGKDGHKQPFWKTLGGNTLSFFNKLIFGFGKSEKSGLWNNLKNFAKDNWKILKDEVFKFSWDMLKNRWFPITKDFLKESTGWLFDQFKGTLLKATGNLVKAFIGDENLKKLRKYLIDPLTKALKGFRDLSIKAFQFLLKAPAMGVDKLTDNIKRRRLKAGKGNYSAEEIERLNSGKSGYDWNGKGNSPSFFKTKEEKRKIKAAGVIFGQSAAEDVTALNTERSATFLEQILAELKGETPDGKKKDNPNGVLPDEEKPVLDGQGNPINAATIADKYNGSLGSVLPSNINPATPPSEEEKKSPMSKLVTLLTFREKRESVKDKLQAAKDKMASIKDRLNNSFKTDNGKWLGNLFKGKKDPDDKDGLMSKLGAMIWPAIKMVTSLLLSPFKLLPMILKLTFFGPLKLFFTGITKTLGFALKGMGMAGKGAMGAIASRTGEGTKWDAFTNTRGVGFDDKERQERYDLLKKSDKRDGTNTAGEYLDKQRLAPKTTFANKSDEAKYKELKELDKKSGKNNADKFAAKRGTVTTGDGINNNKVTGKTLAGRTMKGAGVGMLVSGIGGMAGDAIGGETGETISGMANWAGMGAMVGSIVPGIGTALGAGAGALLYLVTQPGSLDLVGDMTNKFNTFVTEIPEKIGIFFEKIPDMIMGMFWDGNEPEFNADGSPKQKEKKPSIMGKIFSVFGSLMMTLAFLPVRLVTSIASLATQLTTNILGGIAGALAIGGIKIFSGLRKGMNWVRNTRALKHIPYIGLNDSEYAAANAAVDKDEFSTIKATTDTIKNATKTVTGAIRKSAGHSNGVLTPGKIKVDPKGSGSTAGVATANGSGDTKQWQEANAEMNKDAGSEQTQNWTGGSVKFSDAMADYTKGGDISVNDAINAAADNNGLDRNMMHAIAMVESSKNPKAVSKSGTYKGLYQMGPHLYQKYGITDPLDPAQNAMGAARYMNDNKSILAKAGVPINATTLYLAHQQGPSGLIQIYNAATKGGSISKARYRAMMGNAVGTAASSPRDFLTYWDARMAKGGKAMSAQEANTAIAKANGVMPNGGPGADTTADSVKANMTGLNAALAAVDGREYTAPPAEGSNTATRADTSANNTKQTIDAKVAQNSPSPQAAEVDPSTGKPVPSAKSNEEIMLEELKRQTTLLAQIASSSGLTANVFNGNGLSSLVNNIVDINPKVNKSFSMVSHLDSANRANESRPGAGTMNIARGKFST